MFIATPLFGLIADRSGSYELSWLALAAWAVLGTLLGLGIRETSHHAGPPPTLPPFGRGEEASIRGVIVDLAELAAEVPDGASVAIGRFSPLALVRELIRLGRKDLHLIGVPVGELAVDMLIGAGAHFTQVLPDIESDRRQHLLGLPQRIGPRASAMLAAALLASAAAVIAAGTNNPVPLLVTTPLAVGVTLVRRTAAFRLTLATAVATVGAFLLSGSSLAERQ